MSNAKQTQVSKCMFLFIKYTRSQCSKHVVKIHIMLVTGSFHAVLGNSVNCSLVRQDISGDRGGNYLKFPIDSSWYQSIVRNLKWRFILSTAARIRGQVSVPCWGTGNSLKMLSVDAKAQTEQLSWPLLCLCKNNSLKAQHLRTLLQKCDK